MLKPLSQMKTGPTPEHTCGGTKPHGSSVCGAFTRTRKLTSTAWNRGHRQTPQAQIPLKYAV